MGTLRMGGIAAGTLALATLAACGGSAARAPVYSGGYDTSPAQPGAPAPAEEAGAPAADSSMAGAPRASSGAFKTEVAPSPESRPGLGTQWGETRFSRIDTVPFTRANANSPLAMASVFYNDDVGARAQAASQGSVRFASGLVDVGGGLLQMGLKDERGTFISGYVGGDHHFLVGQAGQRYSIFVRNKTGARFEVVLSVDGLDVLDGKSAAFTKRGYLVEPFGELEVDGFRQSTEAVAAFRFGSVRDSYAAKKHGETRNVGVIGIAAFHERGSSPQLLPNDVIRRQNANPFPGSFATPP